MFIDLPLSSPPDIHNFCSKEEGEKIPLPGTMPVLFGIFGWFIGCIFLCFVAIVFEVFFVEWMRASSCVCGVRGIVRVLLISLKAVRLIVCFSFASTKKKRCLTVVDAIRYSRDFHILFYLFIVD